MRKRIMIITIGVVCVVIALVNVALSYPWVIYPTKSSSQTLSVVCHSGFWPNKPEIILKQYLNDKCVNNTLVIKNGVRIQEPQSYELPQLYNGVVEVNVELGDETNSSFTLIYDAEDLYQNGLLLYLADYKDNGNLYVYFVSGKETTCYSKEANSDEWTIRTKAPSPKFIPHKEYMCYISTYSGWKENEWVFTDFSY